MRERMPRPTIRSAIQRKAVTAEATPAPTPTTAAALPRRGFASLSVHPPAARADRGNLPGRLRSGIERLSGVSMHGVKVHYNSPRPAKLDALATAQGREIHLAPGQDHYLPHEAWHIVQQAQGRVKPTVQAKGGPPINEDKSLEREADTMGARAMAQSERPAARPAIAAPTASAAPAQLMAAPPIQLGKRKQKNQRSQTNVKKATKESAKLKNKQAKQEAKKAAKHATTAKKRGYQIGQHGAKSREQKRLKALYNITVSGDTHESEHTVGYEPIARSSGEKRGVGSRARGLENSAPAYQEVKRFHRDHIGTGTHSTPDNSGFNSEGYRAAQRSLVESGDVGSAVQLNQLGYAFDDDFKNIHSTPGGKAATDSFDTMVSGMSKLTYAKDDMDVETPIDAKARAEMYLSRRAAITGKFPTRDEENVARRKFGLEELKDEAKMDTTK